MTRFDIPNDQPYVLLTGRTIEGYTFFSCFSEKKPTWGYRGCGVFSCRNSERAANVKALLTGQHKRYRVFDQDTGRELTA